MVTATGLDAQVGVALETTVGTAVTVTKFVEFNSEGFEFDPSFIEPEGLRAGVKFKRGSRLVQSRKQVTGSLDLNHATRTMGTFWKAALGSSVATPAGATRTASVTTTSASTSVTAATATFFAADVGAGISGTGIPAGATIASFVSSTSVTISAAATASGTVSATIASVVAFKQVHQTGDLIGKSLTVQVGRPEPISPYTTRAHTYSGCKVTDWEFSVSDNEVAKMSLSFDGFDESIATALATASYVASEEFNFSQCTALTLGGTVSGTTELSIAGGTPVASVVKSLSLKGNNALATERYGLGNAGTKKEQLENGIPTITGTLEAEYNQTEFYVPFKANTSMPLLVRFEGSAISSGADKNTLEFVIAQIKIKKVTPKVDGPDIVGGAVEFEVYSDGVNNPFQVRLVSADSTAI